MEVGNNKAMREALEMFCGYSETVLNTGMFNRVHLETLLNKAKAALAKPPRNCDVGDAVAWEKRFGEECDKGHTCSECPVRHAETRMAIEIDKGTRCAFIWAQMPYDKGDAK